MNYIDIDAFALPRFSCAYSTQINETFFLLALSGTTDICQKSSSTVKTFDPLLCYYGYHKYFQSFFTDTNMLFIISSSNSILLLLEKNKMVDTYEALFLTPIRGLISLIINIEDKLV